MDPLELGCACLQLPFLKPFMDGVGLLGRGVTAPAIGLLLVVFGYCSKRPDFKRAGWAVLISLAITAAIVNALKFTLQMPRPTPRSGYGFPSGDSGTAFSLAAAIGVAFPALAPVSIFLATLTSLSRLYFRAHYVRDIVGGAVVGILCGTTVAFRMLPDRHRRNWFCGWPARLLWIVTALIAGASAIFFFQLERKIAEHRRPDTMLRAAPAGLLIDFGTPAAQPYLISGWSENKFWRDPPLTINWVEGLNAALAVSLTPDHDWRLRVRAYPYRPKGFVCQWTEVSIDGRSLGRFYLEQDWNVYELELPKDKTAGNDHRIDFHFPYAETFNWHGVNPRHKPLSVAFDFLEIHAENPPH
jgi:membrane-associated phospholipid phosphatase